MTDTEIVIEEYLQPLGVGLIIPEFLRGRDQFTEAEAVRSQQIAK